MDESDFGIDELKEKYYYVALLIRVKIRYNYMHFNPICVKLLDDLSNLFYKVDDT